MLESKKIELRRSEVRQNLATLAGKEAPTEDEVRQMGELDREYRTLETRYRAALVAEDGERREAGAELETRGGREWADLVAGFELRQVALALDEGRALSGKTAEVVTELRNAGGFRGVPVPWAALERRAGETVSTGTPDPIQTRPIIDRLFPASVAARMGAESVQIDSGAVEWPLCSSSVSAGWAATETGAVADPTAYTTTDVALKPDHTLGVQMKLTRKALKQSGDALEAAIRRDMQSAIGTELDRAIFLGAGAGGEPLGVVSGAATYGITETDLSAAASWAAFRAAVVRFMTANTATGPGGVRMLIRPEIWDGLDGALISGTAVSEWDRLTKNIPAANVAMTTNALAAPSGDPAESKALLTTNAGGVAPIYVGLWGAVDVIRDPYSDAASGGLRITALATVDVQVLRASQLEILTGVQ